MGTLPKATHITFQELHSRLSSSTDIRERERERSTTSCLAELHHHFPECSPLIARCNGWVPDGARLEVVSSGQTEAETEAVFPTTLSANCILGPLITAALKHHFRPNARWMQPLLICFVCHLRLWIHVHKVDVFRSRQSRTETNGTCCSVLLLEMTWNQLWFNQCPGTLTILALGNHHMRLLIGSLRWHRYHRRSIKSSLQLDT